MAKVYKGSVAYYMYLLLDLHNENENKKSTSTFADWNLKAYTKTTHRFS